ncbi:MAG: hypothetical protein IKM61_09040 [Eubacteriaceae bacterium]|nr:hypothetical protein [Eubacteriaceae bacterium]
MYKRMNMLLSVLFSGLFMCVAAVQILYSENAIVPVSNFDDGKRVSVVGSSVYLPVGEICIKASDERAVILINGEKSGWTECDEGMKFQVHDGDIVHVDMRGAEGRVVIYISDVSENVTSPLRGSKIPAEGGTEMLFEVKISEENIL